MLYRIDPRLNSEALHTLGSMGHGDCVAVVDRNFPAASTARYCLRNDVVYVDAATTAETVALIAEWMPLEEKDLASGFFMRIDGQPDVIPKVVAEVMDVIAAKQPAAGPVEGLERHAFYDRAKSCFAIFRTQERRFYGSVILRTGVIHPD
jgi:L-fucose mutarotase